MNTDVRLTWRFNLVFALLLLALAGLAVRLGWLMHTAPADVRGQVQLQHKRTIPIPGRPGSIFARSLGGPVLLAGSRQAPGCFVDPALVDDERIGDVAIRAGQALNLDPFDVQAELLRRRKDRFVWLKRRITPREAEAVGALGLDAIGIMHEWQRKYPCGPLAGTVVGFRTRDGRPGHGVELAAANWLAASDGRRVCIVDSARRPIWPVIEQSTQPRDGRNVFLCIDAVIQGYLQDAVAGAVEQYEAKWGVGVVVDPQTGEVLAMCSVPTFDPNRFNETSAEARTNRAVSMPYEPGSALKPIFAAAAVDEGVVTYQTRIDCGNGTYYARKGGRISDHGHSYGVRSVSDVVVVSSNIGMAKIGEKLGNSALHTIARRFGLGERTGVDLPGQSPGIVRPLRKWDGYSLRRVPFGQEISVTALQLTMATASLANGGLLLRPRIVDHVRDSRGQVVWRGGREVVRRVLRPSVAAQTLAVLRDVVDSDHGTGKPLRMRLWSSFGKTGTAQIPGRGGYVDGAYTASFVGGAPATNPRLLCLVSVYWPNRRKGYYGSKVAAPAVRDVLERSLAYLNVPPDKSEPIASRR